MKNSNLVSLQFVLAGLLFVLQAIINPAEAAVLSWSGGGGGNANWNNSANWGFVGIPASGDTLIFSATQPNLLNTNNIAGLTLNQILFVGAGGGYDIRGSAITLTNGVQATNSTGLNTIEFDIALSPATITVNVGSGASLTLFGVLSGSVGLTKTGAGLLTLAGPNSNTYLGTTTINGGGVDLNKLGFPLPATAIAGNLVVGDGVATCTLRNLANLEIADSTDVEVRASSTWNLNGWNETVNSLTMEGSSVTTGAGTLSLAANTLTNTGYGSLITGNLFVGAGNFTIQGIGTLFLQAVVSGSANIVRNGDVSVGFNHANTFTGSVTANGTGYVWLNDPLSLGAAGGGITLNDSAWLAINGNINVTNETLTLNSSSSTALYVYASSTNSWKGSVVLNADAAGQIFTNCVLDISGTISGVGNVTKAGPGILLYSGASPNSYVGTTTVAGGTLLLGKPFAIKAVPGPLIIGSGQTVRLLNSFQIDDRTTSLTMSDFSLLDLAGFSEWVGPTSMQGAQITGSGAGIFYFSGDITVISSLVAQSLITGNAQIWDGNYSITNIGHNYSPDLWISANVSSGGSSGGGLIKDGAGEVSLAGNNTFTGPLTVNGGTLWGASSTAFGSTNAPAIVNNGGSIFLYGNISIGLKPLVLNGPGAFSGALFSDFGTSSWSGTVNLASDSTISPRGASASLSLSNIISGVGTLTKAGAGTLILSGIPANTYSGSTIASAGTLLLSKPAGIAAIPGNLVINNGAIARLANDEQTINAADVLINGGGLFDFGIFSTYLDTLRGAGTVNFGVGGWTWIGLNNGTSVFDGNFTGTGYAPGWTVAKTGTGTFTMNGNSTYTAGITHVNGSGGKLVINGSQPQIPVIVDATTTLGGSGTVGNIQCAGILNPGTGPGILTCSNVFLSSGAFYSVDLAGPVAGVGYDQLNIRGTNGISGAALQLNFGFTTPVALSNQFVIMNNDAADLTVGTFLGSPNNTIYGSLNGYQVRLNYNTGNNDVTLTVTDVPGAAVGSVVSSGNGDAAISPNECNYLNVVITNKTGTAMTGITATLASSTAGVAITQPFSTYANVAGNSRGTNSNPFQISTTTNFVCGSDINLLLSVVSATHGAFTVPVVVPSGAPAAAPLRYDVGASTNIPDVGTIESTNVVAGFTGPLLKVGVALWLTHTFDADLNISLISPDGVIVDLSSGNGAGGNFGTSCSPDASRTTFDDGAVTSITAGSPPFVGTFKPEGSLATLAGGTANGKWRLRVQDTAGGTLGTLRCWSLFLSPADCAPGGGQCELCPNVTIKSYTGPGTPLQAGYVFPDGVPSICGVAKACPTLNGGTFPAENFTFRNGPADACITVTVSHQDPSRGLVAAAYLGSFDPAGDKCTNYLADAGNAVSASNPSQAFAFNVPSNATFVVNVVTDYGGLPFTVAVTGGDCRPALNITDAGASKVRLDWTTAAGGYHLESTNTLVTSGAPVWPAVTNVPTVVNGRFQVTNTVPSSNQFYRLRKPLP